MTATPVRSLVLWFPDWPVTAVMRTAPVELDLDPDLPLAVIHAGLVQACSPAARAEGVRRGQKRRDAQGACPTLQTVPADLHRDERAFHPLVSIIEELSPGVQILRPGLCALPARGPARFYGGEDEAARVLLATLAAEGLADVRAGIADGPFTAEHAARSRFARPIAVVPSERSAAFLAPLPVTVLDDPQLADLLARLGVQTLGEFAALDPDRVRDRLSEHGARLQALASGADSRPLVPRVPPPELTRELALEPPLELAEQIAFAVRQTAEDVVTSLGAAGLVCTEVRIELTDDRGRFHERLWLHPTCFDAGAIVDRVRWQLQGVWESDSPALTGGVAHVRIVPATVDDGAHHQPGLFGPGADARLHHALSRVQGMLGHRGVVLPVIAGGRRLADRQELVPWSDRVVLARDPDRPWPGHLPAPVPATVFTEPPVATVHDDTGHTVTVDERGAVNAPPHRLGCAGYGPRTVVSWAGPWPLHERAWDRESTGAAHRFQFITEDGVAWLVLRESDRWVIEGRYD